ncbi:MAG TPA: preprotein translocase subunit SecA, partial [Chloroflexi bacterium]|nr:preprotein translocase subunit SecA [Chloroflexota bacterium]HCG30332.1 preprotein translocase subunit SecA [Chloroflexota bacterium]
MKSLLKKVFGPSSQKTLSPLRAIADEVNALEDEYRAMDDIALAEVSTRLREQLADGATLDDLLPESFAATREAAQRTLGQRHFDVQLMGGAVLHQG